MAGRRGGRFRTRRYPRSRRRNFFAPGADEEPGFMFSEKSPFDFEGTLKRKRGRPKGSKNRPKRKPVSRPKRKPVSRPKRRPGRPKGSKRKSGGVKVARKRKKASNRRAASYRAKYMRAYRKRKAKRNPSPAPVRRRRRPSARRRNYWKGNTEGHRKASRKGWSRRKRCFYRSRRTGRRRMLRASTGYVYKKPRKSRVKGSRVKRFNAWRNRRRNFGLDTLKHVLLVAAGFIGAAILIAKVPQAWKDKIKVSGMDLAPALIPLAAGVGLMFATTKVSALSKHAGIINAIALGLTVSGGVFLLKEGIKKASPELAGKLGVSGWIETPFSTRGYVPSVRGYVPRVGEYLPSGLGNPNGMPSIPGINRSLAIPGSRAMSEVPYGTGLPKTVRDYNRFAWAGVYGDSTYE
jgi:hypothetical protein